MDNVDLLHVKQLRATRKRDPSPPNARPLSWLSTANPSPPSSSDSDIVVYYLDDADTTGPKIYQESGSRRHWMMLDEEIREFGHTRRKRARQWVRSNWSWAVPQHNARPTSKPLPPLPFDHDWVDLREEEEGEEDWDDLAEDQEEDAEEFIIIPRSEYSFDTSDGPQYSRSSLIASYYFGVHLPPAPRRALKAGVWNSWRRR